MNKHLTFMTPINNVVYLYIASSFMRNKKNKMVKMESLQQQGCLFLKHVH